VMGVLTAFGRQEAERLRDKAANTFPPDRARRCIDQYALSSSFTARCLARRLSEQLELFPRVLLEGLADENGLFLPEERQDIADLCLRFCREEEGVRRIAQYLCTECLATPTQEKYSDLRDQVAFRLGELQCPSKARVLEDFTWSQGWEVGSNLEDRDERQRGEAGIKVLQLLGDAFASLGEEALQLLRQNLVHVRTKGGLPLWYTFTWKLCVRHSPAKEWFKAFEKRPTPAIPREEVQKVSGRIDPRPFLQPDLSPQQLLSDFLKTGVARVITGSPQLPEILDLLRARLLPQPDPTIPLRRVLLLLQRCRKRQRRRVLELAVALWGRFAADRSENYEVLLEVACQNGLPFDQGQRQQLIDLLERDRQDPSRQAHKEQVEYWLDHLLQQG
jgi:hypothetical protein